ncbi:MAG: CRISPR-associated protein Cas4, partial [bacterium]
SELVKIGKYYHEQRQQNLTEKDKDTEIMIESIKLDSIEEDYVIEYKKKNSSEDSAKAQLLYYLYQLKQKGVIKKGILKFKESKKDIEIELTPDNEKYILELMHKTETLLQSDKIPSVINKPKCKKCAYYEYCYS